VVRVAAGAASARKLVRRPAAAFAVISKHAVGFEPTCQVF
jgi:hypothetical protein